MIATLHSNGYVNIRAFFTYTYSGSPISKVVENAPSLKVDPSKGFLVGGHSAGGNLSAVLAHEVKNDPFFAGRQITGQLLKEPATVHFDAYPDM